MLNGGDIENDSDADLDALLEDANRLVGRPSTSRKRAKTGKGRHVSREDLDEGQGRAGRKGRKQGNAFAGL